MMLLISLRGPKLKVREKWSVDWAGYMGLENMTEEEIREQKKKFRDHLQIKAIELLEGDLSRKMCPISFFTLP